jgi:hypothetical protein
MHSQNINSSEPNKTYNTLEFLISGGAAVGVTASELWMKLKPWFTGDSPNGVQLGSQQIIGIFSNNL